MKKNKGFTLSEVVIALGIMATIIALSITVRNTFIGSTNLSIKKASMVLNEVIQNLLNDANYYAQDSSFVDLKEVRLADNTPVRGEIKFKELFKSMIKLHGAFTGDRVLLCPILVSEYDVEDESVCYMTEDGIVWGIPNTDFRENNVVKILSRGYETPYLPISVYVNCKLGDFTQDGVVHCEGSEDGEVYFDKNAVVFAIRQDGDIKPYSRFDCTQEENKEILQCRLGKIISDKSI